MRDADFLELLNEIENMTIEQYKKDHELACKMKKSCFYIHESSYIGIIENDAISVSSNFSDVSTMGVYASLDTIENKRQGDSIWPKAA